MTISLFNAERLRYGRDFEITINGKDYRGILYEDCRINEVYGKSKYVYGLRHQDDDWSTPASIALTFPMVNFLGTFITKKPIPITEETEVEDYNELDS